VTSSERFLSVADDGPSHFAFATRTELDNRRMNMLRLGVALVLVALIRSVAAQPATSDQR
jgi:hypothetical protein